MSALKTVVLVAFLTLVATAGAATSPAASTPAPPQRQAPVGPGGNPVIFDPFGGDVKITVPIDVRGPARLNDKAGRPTTLAAMTATWKRVAEARWRAAFARMSYQPNCPGGIREPMRFKLTVNFHLFAANATRAHAGHHRIKMINKPGEGHVYRPKGSPPKPSDFVTVYHKPATGDWGRLDGNEGTHEISHLLGLSDDYKKVNGKVVPIVREGMNRKGTLLADPKGRIDQQLIDRLGRLIEKATGLTMPCIVTYDVETIARMTISYPGGRGGRKESTLSWTGTWPRVKFRIMDLGGGLLIMPIDPSQPFAGTATVSFTFAVSDPIDGSCRGEVTQANLPMNLIARADGASFDFTQQLAGLGEQWTAARNAAYDAACVGPLNPSAHLIDSGYAFFDWDMQDASGVTAMLDPPGLLVAEVKRRAEGPTRPRPIAEFAKGQSFTLSFDRSWVEPDENETAILRVHFRNVPPRR